MTTNLIPGSELCTLFYSEIIKPILDLNFPGTRYSAALIGTGFEVLGFDTELSRDHDWGPRVKLFFNEDDFEIKAKQIKTLIKGICPINLGIVLCSGQSTDQVVIPAWKSLPSGVSF